MLTKVLNTRTKTINCKNVVKNLAKFLEGFKSDKRGMVKAPRIRR